MIHNTVSDFDRVPQIPDVGVPDDEIEFVSLMYVSLVGLSRYIREFESDLTLCNFCLIHLAPFRNTPKENRDEISTWLSVAARDGAFNIYHFGQSVRALNSARARCKSLDAKIDRSLLKIANKLFESKFPNNEKIRHTVGHDGEFQRDPRHHLKGKTTDMHGFNYYEGVQFMTSMHGRTFTTTYGGEIFSYNVDESTLRDLIEVKRAFFAAFRPLESADQPPSEYS